MKFEHIMCLHIIIFYNHLMTTHKMLLMYVFQIINIQEIEISHARTPFKTSHDLYETQAR